MEVREQDEAARQSVAWAEDKTIRNLIIKI